MPDGCWPSPVGVGGGTTPPFGHPSLKEGNVSGSLTSAGRRCILLRKPPRPEVRTTTCCRRATPRHSRRQSRLRSRNIMESRRETPPHPRKQHRSRDIPLLSGGVAEGRGGRPARPSGRAPPPNPLSSSPLQQKCTFAHIYGIIYAKNLYFCGFFVSCAKCSLQLVVSS